MRVAIEATGFDAPSLTILSPSREWLTTGGHETLGSVRRFVVRGRDHAAAPAAHQLPDPGVSQPVPHREVGRDARRVLAGAGDPRCRGRLPAEEFEGLGVPFGERARRLDETLQAMKAAWADELPGNIVRPRCVQQPHPPIWAGGNSSAAMRRAITHGDGWSPFPRRPRTAAAVDTASTTDTASWPTRSYRLPRAGRGGRSHGAARRVLHAVLASGAQGHRRSRGVRGGGAGSRPHRSHLARVSPTRAEHRRVLRHGRRVRRAIAPWPTVTTSRISNRERQDLHPRADRHHRAQPVARHAPHDRELGPDRARRTRHALFRRVGHRRSTGRWPEVVNLWELDGWDGLVANFAHELASPSMQDPALAQWWAAAAELRRGGFDRIVVPEPWSPTIEELTDAELRGVVYARDRARLRSGPCASSLYTLARRRPATLEPLGSAVGAVSRRDDQNDSEAIVIWALPSWEAWGQYEWRGGPAPAAWRAGW